jgi:uncharacterized membrane protein (DUF2068 family)
MAGMLWTTLVSSIGLQFQVYEVIMADSTQMRVVPQLELAIVVALLR